MAKKISVKGDEISMLLRGSGFEYVDKLLDLAAPKNKEAHPRRVREDIRQRPREMAC